VFPEYCDIVYESYRGQKLHDTVLQWIKETNVKGKPKNYVFKKIRDEKSIITAKILLRGGLADYT